MKVETCIFFEGRCDEALDFYQEALGAKVESRMRFSESPDPVPKQMLPPGGAQRSPLQKTFFSPCFGMLRDKFGVGWMVLAQR